MIRVVFVHYRMPEQRLREHIEWNGSLYERLNCEVIVVSERMWPQIPYTLPSYARNEVYYEPMEVFSLAKTKNHGIKAAMQGMDDSDLIICTDPDMAFPEETFDAMCTARTGYAFCPVVYMALRWTAEEIVKATPDTGMTNTFAMTVADWKKVHYDENYVGYGGEDGKIKRDVIKNRIAVDRHYKAYHIAHDPTKPQSNIPGHGRADCWNRDNGFNPDNFATNRKIKWY